MVYYFCRQKRDGNTQTFGITNNWSHYGSNDSGKHTDTHMLDFTK